jgi:histone deacetylase complex regulatory component SIN3
MDASFVVLQYDFQRDCSAMFEKIRRRVANSTWNDFLKVLMMYVDNVVGEVELLDLVSCVIGTASNDLVSMFEDFMRRCATLASPTLSRAFVFTRVQGSVPRGCLKR